MSKTVKGKVRTSTTELAKLAARLRSLGFDQSCVTRGDTGRSVSVSCSQCDALVINGIATHESGCPNAKRR